MSEGSAQLILEEVRLLRMEFRQDIKDLHVKVDRVELQTTKTNGRVTSLEKAHETCPGKKALELSNANETEKKTKDTKEYKVGNLLITSGIAASIVLGFLGILISLYKIF